MYLIFIIDVVSLQIHMILNYSGVIR